VHAHHVGHLIRRFFGSLSPAPPSPADDAWAMGRMTPAEAGLWRRMSSPDRRHAVVVARRVDVALGPAATRPVLVAALLHDVGKIESGFGPVRRAAATVAGLVGGHATAREWRGRKGPVGRVGLYLGHDEIGADLLAAAGSDAFTVAWAREHHLPPQRWTVDPEVGAALKAADDD
jgi:hypothetical protein